MAGRVTDDGVHAVTGFVVMIRATDRDREYVPDGYAYWYSGRLQVWSLTLKHGIRHYGGAITGNLYCATGHAEMAGFSAN